MKKLKVLDLFSGLGGFSLGLERTGGFETVGFVEIDKHCQKVLKKHWPNVPIFDDIKEIYAWGDAIRYKGKPTELWRDDIDVICGGFPCQDVSYASPNRDSGINGERSGLWKEYVRLIDEIKPKYAIIENVENLRKNGLGVVLNDLAGIGYDAEWACITADSVGYPHQRKRLFIISYPSSQRFNRCFEQGGSLSINEERSNTEIHSEGKECKPKSIEVCPILSRGFFERIRSTFPDEREAISRVRRVTDGFSEGMDESRRKQRIKQLGNAIVPRIAEIIGKAILENSPKMVMEFNLIDEFDVNKFYRAASSTDAYIALHNIKNHIFRPARKHGYTIELEALIDSCGTIGNTSRARLLIGKLEDMFNDFLKDYDIDLDDLE